LQFVLHLLNGLLDGFLGGFRQRVYGVLALALALMLALMPVPEAGLVLEPVVALKPVYLALPGLACG
jgi:hypothetical protein